jgi:hypothetical protein
MTTLVCRVRDRQSHILGCEFLGCATCGKKGLDQPRYLSWLSHDQVVVQQISPGTQSLPRRLLNLYFGQFVWLDRYQEDRFSLAAPVGVQR